jgi:radical SAM superfamily enzyme YgiQ (UPF0313 family)
MPASCKNIASRIVSQKKKMKVLLIHPRLDYGSPSAELRELLRPLVAEMVCQPCLTLLTVAAVASRDADVFCIDENHGQEVSYESEVDLVGISFMTPQAPRAYEIAVQFRKRGTRVVLGGIHATMLPHEAQQFADAVVIGEAEAVWPALVSDWKCGALKPFYRGVTADLSTSPVPRYDLFFRRDPWGARSVLAPLQFSRGCPRNCSFCSVSRLYGRRLRTKHPRQILSEVAEIQKCFPNENVLYRFNDANPFAERTRIRGLLEALVPLRIKTFFLADISIARDRPLLELLRRSGCLMVSIGFESLEEDVLRRASAWKGGRLSQYTESVRALQESGIMVSGNFMLGLHRHTKRMLETIRDFILENNIIGQCTIATPYPGTDFYEMLEKEGRLRKGLPWSAYDALHLVFRNGMSERKLLNDMTWLYRNTFDEARIAKAMRHCAAIQARNPC